jgi:hypothetical protein
VRILPQRAALNRSLLFGGGNRGRVSFTRRTAVAALATAMLLGSQGVHGAPLATTTGPGRETRIVTLLTGERVVVGTSPSGRPTLQIVRSSQQGPASPLTTASLNGDQYVIPASAQPYLGRYLDAGLFDVTKVAAAGITDRVPLRITYTPGTSPSLPGVTITSSGTGVATGYVTASSARTFGTALAAQAVADSQAGWPASSKLFGSVTRISLDLARQATVTPDFPQVTLIIKGISHTGGPIRFSFGFLMNADDGRKYSAFIFLIDGEARVSVPLGHYLGIFDEFTFSRDGSITERVMPVVDYDVTGGSQTMRVDARLATATLSVTAPKVSAAQELIASFGGSDARGYSSFEFGYDFAEPGGRLRVVPTPAPAVGTFGQTTRWILVDPSTPGGRYLFDASFQADGVPTDQTQAIPKISRLATVDDSYASDRLLRIGGAARLVFVPGSFFAFATFNDVPMPLHRLEYVLVPTRSLVLELALADINAWDPGFMDEGVETADPGSVRSESWLRNPYILDVPSPTDSDPFPLCFACRSSGAMTFVSALTDGVPTHQGEVFGSPGGSPVAHFKVYRNGTLLLQERDSLGDAFSVPTGPATYRVVTDLTRIWTNSLLSTYTITDVTFRSGLAVPMPPSWYCFTARNCSVLPVLRALIDLHASPQGSVPVGTTTFDVSAGHIADAADPDISSVRVAVRRSGTIAWTPLPVAQRKSGHYRATFTAQAWLDGRAMDVRVRVTDVKGGVLTQTTERAFLVST